jgi:ribosomal protein S18 acetylase RimI-like enzyme
VSLNNAPTEQTFTINSICLSLQRNAKRIFMTVTIVTTDNELEQIRQLSQRNLRTNISEQQQKDQGFITWNYSFQLLKQMNEQCGHVVVKDNGNVVGYALVALKQASVFHKNLNAMMIHLEALQHRDKLLRHYEFYVMGQICIDDGYRSKGVFQMLYMHHKKLFERNFDFVVTEISTSNPRSISAHEKIGFKTIHTYKDALDEWNVVLWDWK